MPETDSIDPQRVYTERVACPMAHPEVCAKRDKNDLGVLTAIAKALQRVLRNSPRGTYHHIRLVGLQGASCFWFCMGYKRVARPKLCSCVPAVFDSESLILALDAHDDLDSLGELHFEPLQDITFVKRLSASHDRWIDRPDR